MSNRKLLLKASEIAGMEGEERIHFLNPNAKRIRKSLGDAVGLSKIGVHIITVESGKDTTEYHKHYHEEECLYVLAGQGTLRLGQDEYRVESGDFVGFPADTEAHMITNTGTETLVCLVMGQRLDQDVADYPDKNKRLYRNNGQWDLVDIENITDPRVQ